jgi:hypothetical protein
MTAWSIPIFLIPVFSYRLREWAGNDGWSGFGCCGLSRVRIDRRGTFAAGRHREMVMWAVMHRSGGLSMRCCACRMVRNGQEPAMFDSRDATGRVVAT